MIVRNVVVLPAPLRPTRQTSSPAAILKLTPRRISLLWISTARSATSSTASQPPDHGRHDVAARPDHFRAAVGENFPIMHSDDAARITEHNVHVVLDLNNSLCPGLPCRPSQHFP